MCMKTNMLQSSKVILMEESAHDSISTLHAFTKASSLSLYLQVCWHLLKLVALLPIEGVRQLHHVTLMAAITRLSVLSLHCFRTPFETYDAMLRQYPGNSISLAWIPDFQCDKEEGEVLWPRVSQDGRFSVDLERACGECWKYRDVAPHTFWEISITLIPEREGHIDRTSTPYRSSVRMSQDCLMLSMKSS